ncbi:ferredoxin [Kitasatospora sp. NPDC059571]|uniref:ferredoxin n=1 Tax=Kitasatospora sp. NPDC059571 TaxID=3346871 RepID=UPI003693A2D3
MTAAAGGAGLEVRVDRLRCVGSGQCAAAAPQALELGEDGRARPRHPAGAAPAGSAQALTQAADLCPTEALAVYAGGELIAPAD